MTDPHPLTDDIIEEISSPYLKSGTGGWMHSEGVKTNMRIAYDEGRNDQLEQVIEWLKSNLTWGAYLEPVGYSSHQIDVADLIFDLKAELRPQEDNND